MDITLSTQFCQGLTLDPWLVAFPTILQVTYKGK